MSKSNPAFQDTSHKIDEIHRFTSARWLWGEHQQLEARYVKFDMHELLRVAATALGSNSCTKILKVSEGQHSKVFQLTMDNGHEVIAKLPNPNAGRQHFITASEVATMDFLRNALHFPIPKVYAWSSKSDNSVGAEYIIMEKQSGIMLGDVWTTMKGKQKASIVQQVVEFEKTLTSTKFTKIGGLYYKEDLHTSSKRDSPLYVDGNGNDVYSAEFEIGPTNHRSFFDFGKGGLDIDCGPWPNVTTYLEAIAKREAACVKAGLKYPIFPEGLFYGPRQYQPTAAKKLSALDNYLKVSKYILPDNKAVHDSVLWHGDLHSQNIFVSPEDPSRIVGIIDWQSVSACPLFMQVTRPGFLDYDGPTPKELARVSLPPNFDSMSAEEQVEAKALYQSQTLHNLYLALTVRSNPVAFQALQGHNTPRQQASVLPGLILTDCEPCLNSLLRDIKDSWPAIVGVGSDGNPSVPCPLEFSAADVEQQERDVELWAQGVELMNEFIKETGGFKHWDGRVETANYDLSKRQLVEGINNFLNREAKNEEEREAWLKVLPFADSDGGP
ncbi:phosphotransferase enzyme family protein [Nannizzia gypsea CBS 118893]|uniref:Phosphotransferase enzyme family protein n=1 Tax=Arthroderma gypseum (strain ATCC MYA-4604 / CBS 118893) TaxID=535722 RepID=E4UR57_ARTGP|nr:phosphotransferase enzyme family protein [Nannizzia gypsea CBS 118893]EFQ99332.1 phosphotransferase enzyme family protein [Nannizzia gypsea CBS 118893]